jgi:hypothetical protein
MEALIDAGRYRPDWSAADSVGSWRSFGRFSSQVSRSKARCDQNAHRLSGIR